MSIISTDMTKAKAIHKDKITVARQPKFQELDIEYQRAIEADDATKKSEVATKKQALRDAPADSAIDAATTDDGRFIIVPENVVMELKFPDENIF